MTYRPYRNRAFWIANVKELNCVLDNDFILEERLEEKLLMKKLQEINIDSLHGVTDVVELVTGKKAVENFSLSQNNYKPTYYQQPKKDNKQPYEWVYRTYRRYGNVLVSPEIYKKLDLKRLENENGKFYIQISPKTTSQTKECYILWKV